MGMKNDGTFGDRLTAESLKLVFDTRMAKGRQINRPNEAEIRCRLDKVL